MSLSKRQKRKRVKPPRAKRMWRPGRLQSAEYWLKKYVGENVLRGYCKHFGVDWRCAAIELQSLGVKLDPEYLRRRATTEKNQVAATRRKKVSARQDEERPYDGVPLAAYLAGDYVALHAFECERDGT